MAVRNPNGTWTVTRLPSGDWDPEEIKSAVRMTRDGDGVRWTLEGLARSGGLHFAACRSALTRSHVGGEAAIAELLGVSPHTIWPTRYLRNGTRKVSAKTSANTNRLARAAFDCHRSIPGAA
ncbi:helix-turn-helix domain-containing protein [Aureimonas frigidaquae]|uniref:helix-turn-helix domain-containing protein n=1 Tax=Aureimonas frigidaquae TaxID=424757 RepID=UPI0009FAE903